MASELERAGKVRRMYERILERLGAEEMERVKAFIGSKTLRDALELIVDAPEARAELFIPHYWAVYYHDGRGPLVPVNANKLVFFADPKDDPRLVNGYPVRATDIIRLTKEDYQAGLAENARRRANGEGPFMFVLDTVGPAKARPFFEELARGAADRASDVVLAEFDDFIQDLVDTDPDLQGERSEATGHL
jgi:hypothetical protein